MVFGFDAEAVGGVGAVGDGEGGDGEGANMNGFCFEGDELDVGGGKAVVARLEDIVEFFSHLLEGVGIAVYGESV